MCVVDIHPPDKAQTNSKPNRTEPQFQLFFFSSLSLARLVHHPPTHPHTGLSINRPLHTSATSGGSNVRRTQQNKTHSVFPKADITSAAATAQQATCSCGKQSALHCTCDKAASENAVEGARCSCRARPAGDCTCDRAATENKKPDAASACACGVRPAGMYLSVFCC